MEKFKNEPLAKLLGLISKQYLGVATEELRKLDIDRYYYVLLLIEDGQPHITQQRLAEIMQIDKVSVFRMVDYLCEKGMVERQVNVEDRRSQYICLTEKGLKATPKIRDIYRKSNNLSFKGISAKEQNVFFTICYKIIQNITELPQTDVKLDIREMASPSTQEVLMR